MMSWQSVTSRNMRWHQRTPSLETSHACTSFTVLYCITPLAGASSCAVHETAPGARPCQADLVEQDGVTAGAQTPHRRHVRQHPRTARQLLLVRCLFSQGLGPGCLVLSAGHDKTAPWGL